MAIDTAEKRKAAGAIAGVPFIPGVTPNSSKDAEWRQEAGWGYPGVAAGLLVTGPGCWAAGQVYLPEFKAGQIYQPGFKAGQTYTPGFVAGQRDCD